MLRPHNNLLLLQSGDGKLSFRNYLNFIVGKARPLLQDASFMQTMFNVRKNICRRHHTSQLTCNNSTYQLRFFNFAVFWQQWWWHSFTRWSISTATGQIFPCRSGVLCCTYRVEKFVVMPKFQNNGDCLLSLYFQERRPRKHRQQPMERVGCDVSYQNPEGTVPEEMNLGEPLICCIGHVESNFCYQHQ